MVTPTGRANEGMHTRAIDDGLMGHLYQKWMFIGYLRMVVVAILHSSWLADTAILQLIVAK